MADQPKPPITTDIIVDALLQSPPEKVKEILNRAGFTTPTTAGMTMDQLQTIAVTSAVAARKADRRENPFYPERSVFNPRGLFTDAGVQQPAKMTFTRDVYFVNVRLGRAGESPDLITEEEILLFNRFDTDRTARKGQWTATLSKRGSRDILKVEVPCLTNDERMGLPPITSILLELLEGEEAVRPELLHAKILALEQEVAALKAAQSGGAAA